MFVQIGIWGSKRLCSYIMERNYPSLWMSDLDEEARGGIEKLHPISIDRDFHKQFGSIMPKLIRFYDIPDGSSLAVPYRLDLKPYINEMHLHLSPYMDESVGCKSRFKDSDDIRVYPYLSEESSDYFTTHNLYSDYANEDFLRLVNRQLQNYSADNCYMTQIRAYDPDFDICYQCISVKNPTLLKDKICDEPIEVKQAWLGQHEYGYRISLLESELGMGEARIKELGYSDSAATISPLEMNRLIADGLIDREVACRLQLQHNIKWKEVFDEKNISFMYDLLGYRTGQNYSVAHENDVTFIDFDWDSLA